MSGDPVKLHFLVSDGLVGAAILLTVSNKRICVKKDCFHHFMFIAHIPKIVFTTLCLSMCGVENLTFIIPSSIINNKIF